eukprot:6661184-Prymnesium_polylepis.1
MLDNYVPAPAEGPSHLSMFPSTREQLEERLSPAPVRPPGPPRGPAGPARVAMCMPRGASACTV